jgi:hypothetical protein
MNELEYYHGKKKEPQLSYTDIYVEVNEPRVITTVMLTHYADGSTQAQYFDQPFTGSALDEIRLKCKPSNFNVYKDGRQEAWNHYVTLTSRKDHDTRMEKRRKQYADRESRETSAANSKVHRD